MTIQVSVIIWTVICFLVLMLILKNWLFKPVLKVLDDRRERLEAARLKEKKSQEALKEYKEKIAHLQSDSIKQQKEEIAEETLQIQNEGKLLIEEAEKQRITDVEAYRNEMREDYKKTVEALGKSSKDIALMFAEKIISK